MRVDTLHPNECITMLLPCQTERGLGNVSHQLTGCNFTGCTIGYGDITPTTELGRLIAIIYIPLACLMTGHGLTYIAQSMIDKKENRFLSQYKAKELTQDDIDAMVSYKLFLVY